jgi:hypothetical protein
MYITSLKLVSESDAAAEEEEENASAAAALSWRSSHSFCCSHHAVKHFTFLQNRRREKFKKFRLEI